MMYPMGTREPVVRLTIRLLNVSELMCPYVALIPGKLPKVWFFQQNLLSAFRLLPLHRIELGEQLASDNKYICHYCFILPMQHYLVKPVLAKT